MCNLAFHASALRRKLPRVSAPFPHHPPDRIALFDLDGTLIPWDCQLLFRHFVLRREPWRGAFLPIFLVFLPLVGLLGSGGMKRIFLSYLWRINPVTLAEYGRDFAAAVMPAIYPELRDRIDVHLAAGDLLILASASPESYVREIGKQLGFHFSFGTPVEYGPLFPDLENHKGHAKVVRLYKELPADHFEQGRLRNCHGYTDSTADLPMLALCSAVTVVNPKSTLTQLAKRNGWEILRPARPWTSTWDHARRSLCLLTGLQRDPGGLGSRK